MSRPHNSLSRPNIFNVEISPQMHANLSEIADLAGTTMAELLRAGAREVLRQARECIDHGQTPTLSILESLMWHDRKDK